MQDAFTRTRMLLGDEAVRRLQEMRVAVFGIGGVGGYVCEALVRSGIGFFDLIDKDTVSVTNLNRQIIATADTIGRDKTEVMKERMLAINPKVSVRTHKCFFLPENAEEFSFEEYDYVVDAVDTVAAKIELILRAQQSGVPVISAMGAGNKLDAGRLQVADIYDTTICPLARVMRRELRKRKVRELKVVYSDEPPVTPHKIGDGDGDGDGDSDSGNSGRVPGSTAYVPAVAGLLIAGEIVRELSGSASGNAD